MHASKNKKLLWPLISISFYVFGNSVLADHSLREIERRCEVEWNGTSGELSCSSGVSERRSLERKCSVEWNGSEGEFSCSGGHFKDVERRCTADRVGEIDC